MVSPPPVATQGPPGGPAYLQQAARRSLIQWSPQQPQPQRQVQGTGVVVHGPTVTVDSVRSRITVRFSAVAPGESTGSSAHRSQTAGEVGRVREALVGVLLSCRQDEFVDSAGISGRIVDGAGTCVHVLVGDGHRSLTGKRRLADDGFVEHDAVCG